MKRRVHVVVKRKVVVKRIGSGRRRPRTHTQQPSRQGKGPADRDKLPQLLKGIKNPRVLEIGVCAADYTDIYVPQLPGGEFYLLDCWETGPHLGNARDQRGWHQKRQDRNLEVVRRKYEDVPNVHIIQGISPAAAVQFPDDFFDWIYIDACHRYEAVMADMRAFWDKLKLNGIYAGHDYMYEKGIGVIPAVVDFFGDVRFQITGEPKFKSWWVKKTPEVAQTIYGNMNHE